MNIISVKNLKHKFIDRDEEGNIISEKYALNDVDLDVKQGQFIAILGHNGSGKSTFAKHLNAILMPSEGDISVDGMNTKDESKLWNIRQEAGMVFQNPDNQIISTIVEEDVGFGPENIGVPTKEIWERVEKALKAVDMLEYRKHSPNRLSGGQKQRVAIAGVVAMRPKCIILDEPTAMLDPNGRNEVIRTIKELNRVEKVTIILVTHYMDEVIDADKVFVMDKGKIALSGTPKEVFSKVDMLKQIGLDVPQVTEVAYQLRNKGMDIPLGIIREEELLNYLIEKSKENGLQVSISDNKKENEDESPYAQENALNNAKMKAILEVKDLKYLYSEGTSYEKHALKGISFNIYEGELLGIIGHTGSGKSTLIENLNGLLKPSFGDIIFEGESIYGEGKKLTDIRKNIGLVFQYPEYQLFESTVLLDVCFGPKNLGDSKEEAIRKAVEALKMVGISEDFYERSPFELSGGEKRRVAIAGILAMKPKVLVLDEPTAGLDPRGRDEIFEMLLKLKKEDGITIVVVSHSMEDMGKYADRILVMNKGLAVYEDETRNVFSHYSELEKMGLSAPSVTYIINALKEKGFHIKGEALSVNEAVSMIIGMNKEV